MMVVKNVLSVSIHFGKSGQEILQKVLSVPSVLEPNLHRPGKKKFEKFSDETSKNLHE